MRSIRVIPVFLCLVAVPLSGMAQRVKVSAGLDTNAILIGQQLHMTLRVEQPANLQVLWPNWNDTIIKGVEIVEIVKTDTVFSANKDKVTFTRDYLLTSFDSGGYTIPPIAFRGTAGRDTETVFTEPLFLMVDKPAVDTSKGIRDIKGPVEIPFDWREYLPYILAAMGAVVVLVVVIYLIVYYIRKRRARRAALPVPEAPPVPPHLVALQALEELGKKQLWQQGKAKQYYTELTDILRDYLRDVYKINAPEMLTEEIVQHMKFKHVTDAQRTVIRSVLTLADMVKFAKVKATDTENLQAFDAVTGFVQETAGRDGSEKAEPKGKGGADES